MVGTIQHIVRGTDATVARAYLALFRERSGVMSFLFHSLFRDEREIARGVVDPLQRTTVAQFRQFIEYYLRHGYRFISPADLLAGDGLDPAGRYALITFDDGYYNNVLARPILEEYGVPAVFFISTNHVRENRCFWWDVLYRERRAQGASDRQIYREAISVKSLRTEEIESRLAERFGPDALRPRGDVDRPFTPAELREFANCPYVHLGNHTANHAILTNYTPDEVRQQVRGAQEALREMTGTAPISIAYPNGAHDPQVVAICRELGLKVGFTIRPEKVPLPLPSESADLLRLGRFCPHADAPMESQCRTYRSDVLLYGLFRDGFLRLVRGKSGQ
jgi:peptidoglycan/xylan/chitin deacetylase (PgdA/CDA1 family)